MSPPSGNDDEERFRRFAAEAAAPLARLAYLLCGDRQLAEHLTQVGLIRMYQAWHRIERSEELDGYARQVLLRCWLNERRRAAAPAPGRPDSSQELLQRALAEVPPRQRAAVVLQYWSELSVAETAAALRCSEGTVQSETARGLAALRTATTRLGGTSTLATDEMPLATSLSLLAYELTDPAVDLDTVVATARERTRVRWKPAHALVPLTLFAVFAGLVIVALDKNPGGSTAGSSPTSAPKTVPYQQLWTDVDQRARQLSDQLARAKAAIFPPGLRIEPDDTANTQDIISGPPAALEFVKIHVVGEPGALDPYSAFAKHSSDVGSSYSTFAKLSDERGSVTLTVTVDKMNAPPGDWTPYGVDRAADGGWKCPLPTHPSTKTATCDGTERESDGTKVVWKSLTLYDGTREILITAERPDSTFVIVVVKSRNPTGQLAPLLTRDQQVRLITALTY